MDSLLNFGAELDVGFLDQAVAALFAGRTDVRFGARKN